MNAHEIRTLGPLCCGWQGGVIRACQGEDADIRDRRG